jgi:hypothetical protein
MGQAARRGRSGEDPGTAALSGGGPSQIGPAGAMRARDVSRPTEDDLARAEDLVEVSYRPRSRPRPAEPRPGEDQPSGSGGSSPERS